MTDSSSLDNLQILSEVTVTSKVHSFIRIHGQNTKYRYNYLYSKEEKLKPWTNKVNEITSKTSTLRIYFNNHYGAKAVINAIEFKEMLRLPVSHAEISTIKHAKNYYSEINLDRFGRSDNN
jgi:uncharacterized protein YecE (DUF72 family)